MKLGKPGTRSFVTRSGRFYDGMLAGLMIKKR